MPNNDKQIYTCWRRVADKFGFQIDRDFEVLLESGRRLRFPIRLPQFGGKSGMLIVDDYSRLEECAEELFERGFGYSVMSPSEPSDDWQSFIEVLQDWGWSGDASTAPTWLRESKGAG